MNEELDLNKLGVEFVNSNIDRLVDSMASGMKGTKNAIKSRFKRTYRKYVSRILLRHSRAKSFFIRSEPVPLYDFFVPPDLTNQRRRLKAPGAGQLASVAAASIVTGSGGCGKSLFMRHLLVSAVKQKEKAPILLELRELNGKSYNLREALVQSLNSNGLKADDEYFNLALAAGHYCVLLDGFDELEHGIRNAVVNEVQLLAEKYPQNWYVLSSRTDPKLNGWPGFSVFQLAPLAREQAIELVERLPFDDPIKASFITELSSGLYEKHKSFLSNPLLLSIMLLTYHDVAHIPEKLSLFYSQAYESLFQKHDALKGGFQRYRRSSLDIQDYAAAFSAFCIQSYDKRKFSFTRTEALDCFDKSKDITGLDFDSAGLLDDTIQAVCLMLEDGLEIAFAHRSFQEYFAARFIQSSPSDIKQKLILRFATEFGHDSIMQLLFEVDAYSVEKYFILPTVGRLMDAIKFRKKVGITHYLRYLRTVYMNFRIGDEKEGPAAGIKDAAFWESVHFPYRQYVRSDDRADVMDDKWRIEIVELFYSEFGKGVLVPTSSLRTTSPFVRKLSQSPGWGIPYLETVFEIIKSIKKRHERARSSLGVILQDLKE